MDLFLPLLLFLPDSAKVAIALGMGLGVVVTAGYYMIAYVLQHPPIFAMAKEELSALIFSAILISFWLTAGLTLDPLVRGIFAPAAPSGFAQNAQASDLSSSHIQLALASLEILFQKLKEMYTSMYLFEALIGFLSTISFPLGAPIAGTAVISFSLMPFDGLNLLSNAHTVVVESIGQLMTVVWAKEFILIFARDAIPIIFLPLGLVFRAIPFLRTTGSSIIAICFAGYFILPLAILFSNFLIFDIYQPADFVYAPTQVGVYKTDLQESTVTTDISESRKQGSELIQLFSSPGIAESATSSEECSGNPVAKSLCSAGVVISGVISGAWEFLKTVFKIWTFMMGFTGDFLSFWTNPLLPSSASAGLYYFIIDSVVAHSQFLVLIVVTSVVEIIFTITMYRNIALIIGGELEIAGLTKLI